MFTTKCAVCIFLTVCLFAGIQGRRGSYGNRRPNPRFPPSRPRPVPANQISSTSAPGSADSAGNSALDINGEGLTGQKRFVAQLVSGMIGGMAEQAVYVCPSMCENVLTQLNAVNPTIVAIFRGFLRCPNACQILDSVVQTGLGVTDAITLG